MSEVKLEQEQFVIENTEVERFSINLMNYFLENEDYTLFNFKEKILENFNHSYYDIIIIYNQPLYNDVNLDSLFERMTLLKKKLIKTFFCFQPRILVISTNNEMKLDKVDTPNGVELISANDHEELMQSKVIDIFPHLKSAYLEKSIIELTISINHSSIKYANKLNQIFNKKRYLVNIIFLVIVIGVFLFSNLVFNIKDWLVLKNEPLSLLDSYRLITNSFFDLDLFSLIISIVILVNFGMLIEKIYGSIRYLFLMLMTMIFSNSLLYAFIDTPDYIIGFTPLIYGLIGAYIYTFLVFRRFLAYTIKRTFIFLSIVVIFFIIFLDFTYFTAMIGGLLGGIVASFILGIPGARNSNVKNRGLVSVLSFLLVLIAISIGLK